MISVVWILISYPQFVEFDISGAQCVIVQSTEGNFQNSHLAFGVSSEFPVGLHVCFLLLDKNPWCETLAWMTADVPYGWTAAIVVTTMTLLLFHFDI